MAKRYARINWQDYPSVATPRNATNLNKMDKGIDDCDDAIEEISEQISGLSNSVSTINNNLANVTKYFGNNLPYSNALSSVPDIIAVLGSKNGKIYSEIGNAINPTSLPWFVIELNTFGAVTLMTAIGSDASFYTATYMNDVFGGWIAK